jgi:hypothetical protein
MAVQPFAPPKPRMRNEGPLECDPGGTSAIRQKRFTARRSTIATRQPRRGPVATTAIQLTPPRAADHYPHGSPRMRASSRRVTRIVVQLSR